MENAQQQLNQENSLSQNPTPANQIANQKGNFLPIIGIVTLILAVSIGGFFILNFNNQLKSSTFQIASPSNTPVQTEIKKLSLFYDLSRLGKSGNKFFKADINGQNKTEISIDNKDFTYNIGTIAPIAGGRFLIRHHFKKLDIAPSSNLSDFKTVIKVGEKESISGIAIATDSTKIAYLVSDISSREKTWKLYTANIDGNNRSEVKIALKNTSISPIIFDSHSNKLYVLSSVKIDENRTENNLALIDLASGDYKVLIGKEIMAGYSYPLTPLISPDFKKAYLIKRKVDENIPSIDENIYEFDLINGTNKILYDPGEANLWELRLSPKGDKLAFEQKDQKDQTEGVNIYVFDFKEGKATSLVNKTEYALLGGVGSWSPNGKYLWFSRRTVSIEDDIKNPGKYNNTERNIFENYVINVDSKEVNLFHKDTETEPIRIMGWLAE